MAAFKSIPTDKIVSVIPATIGTGGSPLAMNTVLIAPQGVLAPRIVGVKEFGSDTDVGTFFGFNSEEYKFAVKYFAGYVGATKIPTALMITATRGMASSAVLQSASFRGVELDSLKTEGELKLVINGTESSATINLVGVTSFSEIATLIQAEFTEINCDFNANAQVFELETVQQGEDQSISFADGDLASLLLLTEESGAQVENGHDALTIDEMMAFILSQTLNFGVITFLAELELELKKQAAQWAGTKRSRFMMVIQDTSGAAKVANNPASFGAWLSETEQDGTMAYYGDIGQIAALCGGIAAIDFKRTNGRRNIMFMRQAGVAASVTNEPDYNALISNGYTFYGAFATANDRFLFQTNGEIAGQFKWADNYINQIYLNSQLQLALMVMLESYGSIPYNQEGKSYHLTAIQDPINEMLNFGGIRPLVDPNSLSEQQKAIINSQAGIDIVPNLLSKGWAAVIQSADAQTRGNRGSMPFSLWYTDGGSVQQVNLASINVQ